MCDARDVRGCVDILVCFDVCVRGAFWMRDVWMCAGVDASCP